MAPETNGETNRLKYSAEHGRSASEIMAASRRGPGAHNVPGVNARQRSRVASIREGQPQLTPQSPSQRFDRMRINRSSLRLSGSSAGGRRRSALMRLEADGLDSKPRSSFAVQSIDRGSVQWSEILKPFVSDLVFRSIASRRYQDDVTIKFRPYTCQAAVLFVDLSGYSKITAALAHRGAHVISAAVNAYLERLLTVIHEHGGDVIKFAGDAILVVWEGDEQELEINVLCAARCVLELQTKAGCHEVEGTGHQFRIHCGLCCGPLDSEVFEAPTHTNMQRLYHYVGGQAMEEIGELVDLAKTGEIAISSNCFNFLESGGTYEDIKGGERGGEKLLISLTYDDAHLVELMDWHIEKTMIARMERRDRAIEEDFIHGSVLAHLNHGGLSPTQIAQMRNLCVLFIAMTSKGSSVNWLLEIQAILDRNRCPIVQIIYDDKGVHIVAAVNLYGTVPEASLVGLEVCKELVNKRVGASLGVALGPTFCGVTGSDKACRWDITGAAVVRAARLMQYALSKNVHFAIDQSLYDDPMAATRLAVLDPAVPLKGSPEPITVYTLSDSKLYSAFRILDNVHGSVHSEKVQEVQNRIGGRSRSAVIVTGIPMAGMRIVCQRAAGFSDLVPYLHLCDVSAGFLQVARSIATWFMYVDDREVRKIAESVISDMSSRCWTCAHDQCVRLVNVALRKGFKACFLVDRIQFLDPFSLSLIRECLQTPHVESSSGGKLKSSSGSMDSFQDDLGQICFLCVHTPFYTARSAEDIGQDICRSVVSISVPIVEIGEASKEELRTMFRDLSDIEVEDRWLEAYAEASGHCVEYFLERTEATRNLSAEMWKDGKDAIFETSEDLVLYIPRGLLCKNKELKVTEIRAETAMLFSSMYDETPPLCQMLLRILTIATNRGFYKLPYKILWEALNDLIAQGVERKEMDEVCKEMIDIRAIKMENRDGHVIPFKGPDDEDDVATPSDQERLLSIQNPALADIAMDVCTPIQVQSIAKVLVDRFSAIMRSSFQVPLVAAGLHLLVDEDEETIEELWKQSYDMFLAESRGWSLDRISKWKEIIDDEIRSADRDSREVLGDKFTVTLPSRCRAPPCIAMLKIYSSPVALGTMGQSLSVICRNTFHEYGFFSGARSTEDADRIRSATGSACSRFMMEITVLESYMGEMDSGAPWEEVEAEMEMISFLANPAGSVDEVQTKAVLILEEMIPRFVEHRLQRLRKLVHKLKQQGKTPSVIEQAERPVQLAYRALQTTKNRMDAAQDALMILATTNWKPRSIPEYLPLAHQQTVANVRNKTLKRLSDIEVVMFRHQQTIDDLEAFLIVTPLLQQASDDGLC